MMQAALEQ
jgi:midasin